MSIKMKVGKIVNSFLMKTGYKIVTVDPKFRRTYAEGQLLKALKELSALHNKLIFNTELTTDEESLRLLSDSMYTRFSTGLYLIDYLHQSLILEGEVCEFGTGQGVISALLAYEIKNTKKNIWLFDSFEGFAKPSEKDILINDVFHLGSVEDYKGMMSFPEDMIRARLSAINFPLDRIRIIPGFIEKTIQGPKLPERVCFAYVDFDFYDPILIALDFLDTVIQPGGFIVIDDYNFFSKGAKTAADEFYDSRKERYFRIFPTKTGENFCILCRKTE
ncbi:MAG: TylF/MycF/NovP-related O-methyltransferase [Methanoregula sp.]|jgi:hypothetical protein